MIEARKSPAFEALFYQYNKKLLKKSFSQIMLRNDSDINPAKPTLFLLNHSSWWDGLISFHLAKTLFSIDSYAMMEEKGLVTFPFFKRLGAFSIHLQSVKEIVSSLRHAEQLLLQNKGIWMFPQGKEEHLEKRPLSFKNGAAYLIEKVPAVQVVPITYYYTFSGQQLPNLYIHAGKELVFSGKRNSRKQLTTLLEAIVTKQLDQQRHDVIHHLTNQYNVLLTGKRPVSELFKALKNGKR
ncbi:lysophospholipid acyltransferase family protein [Alkalihalobacterium chitinilyticum]|uniref:Lysophospholipid acyltransferase family protein n=1 Tax=Alkalihalobacterium chitinilyticum TaxID=2980103 RepID=A0ABT5VC75_9BACI|nr:lysophospholipid acyltransferase family protein [Alkalihalobacterium chitinilyticum]MDE5412078.1 lysophospholipid acyltransferase family protein [Alkalihalobacterium chitinilyticum]